MSTGAPRAFRRLPRFARLLAVRLAPLMVAGFILMPSPAPSRTALADPVCTGNQLPFVANFVVPSGTLPDLSGLGLPPEVQITVSPGAPNSGTDLVQVVACVSVQPGEPGVPVSNPRVRFTTATPGAPRTFVTPTNTPPPTATPQPAATATAATGTSAALVTGVRPPSTGDGGLVRDSNSPSRYIAFTALGGLAIGALPLLRRRASDSGRGGHL
jgi:hypothetical protein